MSTSQFLNNSFTLFIVAKSNGLAGNNGSGSGGGLTSVLRFQSPASTYIVYPYTFAGANSNLIISSDGGPATGISGGALSSGSYVDGAAVYQGNGTTNGMQTYLNGTLQTQRNSGSAALPSNTLSVGAYLANGSGDSENANGDVEALVFNTALNTSQRQSVDAFISTTYGVPEPSCAIWLASAAILIRRRGRAA